MAPHIDSLSQYNVTAGERLFAYGTGFHGATAMQVDDQWSDYFVVDGDGTITFSVPELDPGTYWVIVHGAGGDTSPCEDSTQQLTIGDATTQALTASALTPDTVVLGDATTYYVTGTGLTTVHAVTFGNHGLAFEGASDEQLMITIPAELPDVHPGDTVELSLFGTSDTATLQVPTIGRPAGAADPNSAASASDVFSIDPAQLGADGGDVTITGYNFGADAAVFAGDIELSNVVVVSAGTITATVDSLAGYEGQQLIIGVTSNGWAAPESNVVLTVSS